MWFILLVQERSATKNLKLMIQRRIENPVKHVRVSVLWKSLSSKADITVLAECFMLDR